MQIEQTGNYLWIEYNERGFSWEDVEALCSLGSSTKGIAQTGEKGVGFKSAFVLSSRPHILSNPYRFFFDETASCPLPHVTPQRLLADATLPRRPPERGTAVYLPLRKDFPELLNEIVPESLLFLRRLHHVTVGRSSFSLRHQNGRSTLLVADSSGTKEHHYIIARAQELAIAFPLAGGGPAALLSATLPIHWLKGLKTPLNAPFELTANREALRENSQRNVELRDALAELFLQAAAEQEILSSRVWQLQPDAEGGGFWAPFVQRVRAGLQEVPLIPVIDAGQKNRWALKRCRNPSSELLRDLNLLPSDLEKVGLAIPTEEFLRQLPEGSEFNLPEFDAKDLLGLLQCGDISTTWRSYGNEWRQRVVGALERRLSEVDLALRATLRSLALFPTGADDWSSCDDQIYLSLPEGAPEGLLKALHSSRACAADRALLTALGGGGVVATARDVAYAVLQRGLGLADVEDRRFSWTNLAYLGHHWQSILQCGAADEWLAKQTPEQMEELLRSVALPSCSGRLLHCASELRCPFLLGCKSSAADRSNLLAEPPGANDIQARLRWELVFLRLGAQVAEDQGLQLPRNFFAEGVGKELGPLLDHYEQLGVLQTISKKCCIPDRTGCICQAGHLLGPEAVRLLGVVVTPTALLVAQMLKRAAQGGTKTLRRSYEFLSAEWREGRVDEESLLTLKNGMWMLNCEGDLSFEQVADVTWEDVQRQISLWPKDGLHGIFRAMGVSPSTGAEAATPPEASQPANGQNRSGERPPAKSSSQPLTWPALPQVRSMAEDGGGAPVAAGNSANPPAFREPSGAQLPLLGKLLQQIFYSAGGDDMLYGRLGKETREMLASDIHFTHNSISRRFGHGELKGRQVEDVAKALREGNMTTKELPLVVVKFESNYYTLNNRSLYALRKASRAQKPLRAQVAAFETMCPVTAKFIQLRCSSLAGQDESLAQRATNSSEEEA